MEFMMRLYLLPSNPRSKPDTELQPTGTAVPRCGATWCTASHCLGTPRGVGTFRFRFLPNAAGRTADHGLASAARKGLLKFRHVRNNTVDAKIAGGVRICLSPQTGGFRGDVLAPYLSPTQEKALRRCKAIARR